MTNTPKRRLAFDNITLAPNLLPLQDEFELIFIAYNKEAAEEAQSLGLSVFNVPTIPPYTIPAIMRLIAKFPLGRFLRRTYEYTQLYDSFKIQAQQIVNGTIPTAIITGDDDPRGVNYWVCKFANEQNITTLVLHETHGQLSQEIAIEYHLEQIGTRGKRILAIAKWWYRLTGKRLVPHYGDNHMLPNYKGNIAAILGIYLSGARFGQNLAGGNSAQYIGVVGKRHMDIYESYGVPRKKMKPTGTLWADDLYKFRTQLTPQKKKALKQKFDIPTDSNVVSLMLRLPMKLSIHRNDEEFKNDTNQEIQWMVEQIHTVDPTAWVVIKTHPKQSASFYEAIQEIPQTLFIDTRQQREKMLNYELMGMSDLIILGTSTVGLMSIGLHIPLMTFNYHHDIWPIENVLGNLTDGGMSLFARTHEDFAPIVKKLLTDETARQTMIQYQQEYGSELILADGQALSRIKALIMGSENHE